MDKPALLLINLGTPKSPEPREVGNYLKQFLMDPYVIDIPWIFRWVLVHFFIVPKRSRSSSLLYKNIWAEQGSPLLINCYKLAERLKPLLADRELELAMRYGEPSIPRALENLKARGVESIDILPLYPQYATSSVATVLDACRKACQNIGFKGAIRYYKEFYNERAYLTTLGSTINEVIEEKKPDHLLFSFHGLPEHQVAATGTGCFFNDDCCNVYETNNPKCYRAQGHKTARLVQPYLKGSEVPWSISFQSRLGSRPWLKPYTDVVVKDLAKQGVKELAITCPAFTADCLETLEEIEIRIQADFREAGGDNVHLVPSLNDRDDWVCALKVIIDDGTLFNLNEVH